MAPTILPVALLYVDVLGVKARWRAGGPPLVQKAFDLLEEMLREALASVGDQPLNGGIQSDALGLVFAETAEAIRVGRTLLARAFQYSADNLDDPIWLRGVISPVQPEANLLTEEPFRNPNDPLTVRRFSDDLLRAINAEQSGTKGVRLLIDMELVDQAVIDEFAIPVGDHRNFIPLRQLENSLYPKGKGASAAGYADVLWMVPDPIAHWKDWQDKEWHFSKVLRAAGRQPEQFTQLAATALVFSEAGAILGSVAIRRKGGLPGAPGN